MRTEALNGLKKGDRVRHVKSSGNNHLYKYDEQQIIETLATKVMEWDRHDEYFILDEHAIHADYLHEVWNPLQNIADAWMLVEKIKDNDEQKRHFSTWLALTTGTNSIFGVTPKAISMAAYRLVT